MCIWRSFCYKFRAINSFACFVFTTYKFQDDYISHLTAAYAKISQMYETREQSAEKANDKCSGAASMDTTDSPLYTEYKKTNGKIDDRIVELMAERDEAVDTFIREVQNRNEAARMTHEKEKRDLEKRLNDLASKNTALNDRLTEEKENNDKNQKEIALVKQEKSRIESDFAALQTLIEENEKLLAARYEDMTESNERMSNEIKEMANKLMQRDHALNEMTAKLNDKERSLSQTFRLELKRLNGLIADKQKQSETLRTENGMLLKQLNDSDAERATMLNTIQTLNEEKANVTLELTAIRMQSESSMKSLEDKEEENIDAIVRLASENEALEARCKELEHQLMNTSGAKPTTITAEESPLDLRACAGLTSISKSKPTAGIRSKNQINNFCLDLS